MKSQSASLSGETGSSLEKFVGTRVDFFDTNRDMKIERPLSSLKATNGLMSSYAPRPHKRKRKGLRLAVILLLAAVASLVAVDKAKANYIWECQDDITWQLGHDKDMDPHGSHVLDDGAGESAEGASVGDGHSHLALCDL